MDYTKDIQFWNRLKAFVQNVDVNDLPGEEEKAMILIACEEKITSYKSKQSTK